MTPREHERKPLLDTAKSPHRSKDEAESNNGTYYTSTKEETVTNSRQHVSWCQRHLQLALQTLQNNSWIEWDAVYFGVRMSVCITIASFAILLRDPGDEFVPQAMWIVVTVLFVCWFPNSLDAASVVEKCLQRLYGTFLGATTGLTCGFLSLVILDNNEEIRNGEQAGSGEAAPNVAAQSAFLVSCISIYTFVICWGAIQFKVRGKTKIISKFNYACILSLLTFYISILPFYSDPRGTKWRKARWRVTNVIIGCFLGAGLSISIFPRSTKSIVQHKLQHQLRLAGEASQAVLHAAAEQFSETAYVLPNQQQQPMPDTSDKSIRERLPLSRRLWRREDVRATTLTDDEIALTKYEAAITGWKTIQTNLNNLQYDPFWWCWGAAAPGNDVALQEFRTRIHNLVQRLQRIQTTVVLLDGIVKNDPKHNFSAIQINRLAQIGTLIGDLLNTPASTSSVEQEVEDASTTAYTELKAELALIRRDIVELAGVVASVPPENDHNYLGRLDKGLIGRSNLDLMAMSITMSPDGAAAILEDEEENDPFQETMLNDHGGRGAPKHVQGSRVCALLFLQLVEHLALRSLRTYQAWKQCNDW